MQVQGSNLFIVDDNRLSVTALKQFLHKRFGISLNITTFHDGESCLEKVDHETQIVILDYYMKGKNGLEVLKSIKTINPKTEVIMLSGNEDIALAIETFRFGANDYVIKGTGSWKKINKLVYKIITAPLRLMTREFGVPKFMAIFLLTFLSLALVAFVSLRFME